MRKNISNFIMRDYLLPYKRKISLTLLEKKQCLAMLKDVGSNNIIRAMNDKAWHLAKTRDTRSSNLAKPMYNWT